MGDGLSEDEKLLELQTELRAEVRLHIQQGSRQVLTGLTAIGAIIGYSLLAETAVPIASVPFVLGLILVESIKTANGVIRIARQMIDVEMALTEPDSPFRYEVQRGTLLGTKWPNDRGDPYAWLHLDLDGVPEYARLAILLAVYVASVVASAWVFWPVGGVSLLGATVSQSAVFGAYGAYTLLLAAVGSSHLLLRRRQTEEVGSLVAAESRETEESEPERAVDE